MVSMDGMDTQGEPDHLVSARGGDAAAFERLVAGYWNELYAHCYRMLGSVQDAEDAVQESLLGAWRGLAGFEGRSSLRAWPTNGCSPRPGGWCRSGRTGSWPSPATRARRAVTGGTHQKRGR
jgi:hypothetical protein